MLERRDGHLYYYYRHEWRDGQVIKRYVARGDLALALAAEDEQLRAERESLRRRREEALEAAKERVREIDSLIEAWADRAGVVVSGLLTAAGWYRRRGEWRRRRGMSTDERKEIMKEINDVFRRIDAGDASLMPHVTAAFDYNPAGMIERNGGDLAKRVVEGLTDLLAGPGLFGREAVRRAFLKVRDDLAGPDPTPLERMLAERAAVDWLSLYEAELQCLSQETDRFLIKPAEFFERRRVRAHKQFLRSCRELAVVRRLAHRPGLTFLVPPPPPVSASTSTPTSPPTLTPASTSVPAPTSAPELEPAVTFGVEDRRFRARTRVRARALAVAHANGSENGNGRNGSANHVGPGT
jgi:hypothetical protein